MARVRPVSGAITQHFGVRNSAYRLGYHPGTDFSAPVGTTAKACESGLLKYYPGYNGGYGNVGVIILSNGDVLWYAHLSGSIVPSGVRVSTGQSVFKTGATGWVTGPHLHLELRKGGDQNRPVNVMTWLAAGTAVYHTVVSGDTVGKLATRFGSSVTSIVNWNKPKYPTMTANFIKIGWRLRVK